MTNFNPVPCSGCGGRHDEHTDDCPIMAARIAEVKARKDAAGPAANGHTRHQILGKAATNQVAYIGHRRGRTAGSGN